MSTIIIINDILRFLLELVCIVVFGYFGYKLAEVTPLKIILGLLFSIALIIFWYYFGAPKSPNRLDEPFLLMVKIVIFSLTTFMLYFTGNKNVSIIFSITISLNTFITYNLSN